jgi:hypothetical protein
MKCLICKEAPAELGICDKCMCNAAMSAEDERNRLLNDAMKDISDDAERIFEEDPTKGRGRGPKWMDV